MNSTLLILAAGLGSRFGGNKQISNVGPNGEILMEYSIHDAIKAGFKKVVFVLKEEMIESVKATVGEKFKDRVELCYAVQDYSSVVTEQGFGLAFAEALVCAAGAGVGFLVAMLLFCGVRQRVEAANPPESFKGLPITLVSAAITSMSFMGFGGLVENIIAALL